MQNDFYIAIDIGGTSTRVGLFSTPEGADFSLVTRFPTQQSYKQQRQILLESLHAVPGVRAAGVSIAGRVARDGRSIILAPNLQDYLDQPIVSDLEAELGYPVRLAHDTVCGLLGEKKFGSLRDEDRCAYLTVSTGTGAAFQLRNGPNVLSVSMDIGHQILAGNELVCLCGQVGCLETFTGGRQLELRLGHTIAQVTDYAFWETFSDKLALGLINLAVLTRVEAVAVSGAIVLNNAFLLPLLQQKVDNLFKWGKLALKLAMLGENAPLVGAATLPGVPEAQVVH